MACPHDGMIWQGMCAECGQDVSASLGNDHQPMIGGGLHQHGLLVHKKRAETFAEDSTSHLLSERRLVLILDLDLTVLHTTCDGRIAEQWIRDGVENIHTFTLAGSPMRYFTKLRAGLTPFLESLRSRYEMHVYTFGTRTYAEAILSFLDPGRRYFSTRVLTRDESFDIRSKSVNLELLFPKGDSMVAIVDDTPDVWGVRSNLVPALPYKFFPALDEVNALPGQRSRREGERAALRAVYARLPASSTMRVEESLVDALASEGGAGERERARPIAYLLLVAMRVLYEWQADIESELAAIANAWHLNEAALLAIGLWINSNRSRAELTTKTERLCTADANTDASESTTSAPKATTAAATASTGKGVVHPGVSAAARAAAEAEEAAAESESDPGSDPADTLEAEAAANEAADSAELAAAADAVAHSGGQGQALQELPLADALMATVLEGLVLEVVRSEHDLEIRATGATPKATRRQRQLTLSYVTCLRKQVHDETSSRGSLGPWMAEHVHKGGDAAVYEAIKSRVACQQLLDAALLLRVAQIACPSARWPPTTPVVEVLSAMARTAPVVGRMPFIRAPPETDTALNTIGAVLRDLHDVFYRRHDASRVADTRKILPGLRAHYPYYKPWRLAGVRLVFTGVIARGVSLDVAPIAVMARRMGAEVVDELDSQVTHVVMRRAGTQKQRQAMRYPGVFLVHADWIEACHQAEERVLEAKYQVEGLPLRVPKSQEQEDAEAREAAAAEAEAVANAKRASTLVRLDGDAQRQMEEELAEALAAEGDEGDDDNDDFDNGDFDDDDDDDEPFVFRGNDDDNGDYALDDVADSDEGDRGDNPLLGDDSGDPGVTADSSLAPRQRRALDSESDGEILPDAPSAKRAKPLHARGWNEALTEGTDVSWTSPRRRDDIADAGYARSRREAQNDAEEEDGSDRESSDDDDDDDGDLLGDFGAQDEDEWSRDAT